jgi:trigger factor
MDISIKDLGGCKKELAVVISASEIDAELEKAYENVRGQVALPGFRQGKVPRSLIEKKFGRELKVDVANDLFGKAVEKAVEEHKLELVSEPEVGTPPDPPESGRSLEFTFRVEVKPTFELPEYKGLEVEKTVHPVTDEEVNRVIEDLRMRRGVLKPVPGDSGFAAGDYLLSKITVREGDTVLRELDDVPVGGASPRIGGFEIEGLADALVGKKATDTFSLDALMAGKHDHAHDHDHDHGAEGHHHHEEEKRRVQLEFEVKEVKRRELPELDDAFAQEVGEQTLLGLRVAVRKRLDAAHEDDAEKEVEQKLLDQLVDRSSFEMAAGPVDRALGARMERLILERMIHGESEAPARAAVEAEREKVRSVVERDAKAWLIVEKLAKKEKIFALEDDVAKAIAKIAEEQGTTPTKVRESYEAEGVLPELRANVLERKVLDFLKAHGKVTAAKGDGSGALGRGGEEGA